MFAMTASKPTQKWAAEQAFSLAALSANLSRAAARDFASFIRD